MRGGGDAGCDVAVSHAGSDEALTFDATITPEVQQTTWAADALRGLAAGLIIGLSPGFTIPPERAVPKAEEVTEEPDDGSPDEDGEPQYGAIIRTILAALLWELSLVTAAAYSEAEVYRISISEAGGGTTQTALAGEVLHLRIGVDPAAPWLGTAPLRRASLTAGMLQAVESALAEVYENAPLGSQVVPMPENPDVDNTALGRSFRGQRGRVLLRESVQVSAAGGPLPLPTGGRQACLPIWSAPCPSRR